MKNLIILNYQREVPPYLISEINFAKKLYDAVYYVTPVLYNNNFDTVKADNVHIVQIEKKQKLISLLRCFLIILSKEFISDIMNALREKKFGKAFLKHLLTEFVCSDMLFRNAKPLLQSGSENIVLASWFSVEAYAAARLKKSFPEIRAYSFAHAFEIKPEVNKFVYLSLNKFKHCYLDGVYFISETMRNVYHEATQNRFAEYADKEHVRYLGSSKRHKELNPQGGKGFHIVSCASAVKLKRLELILDSLDFAEDCDITWTHLGDGPEMPGLRAEAEDLLKGKPGLKIEFPGRLTNAQVHDYYANEPVDLFVSASSSEGLPVSIMEALSYGIPVLATDAGGTREAVDDSVGKLIPVQITPGELYNHINAFRKLSDDEITEMRKLAFERWNGRFNLAVNAMEFYNEL